MSRFECGILGIDLGTTNTVVGYYDEIGQRGECCMNQEGTALLPSAVYFEDSSTYVVGTVARDGAILHPDRTAMFFKRKMGADKEAITVDGKAFSPQQISALVLKEAVENARAELETEATEAVITVPAYFDAAARRATMEAGEMAGLHVRDILDEPVAALYHCDVLGDLIDKTVLIFDLGGGTFDLVAAEVRETEINEIAIAGDTRLGGSDWDKVFADYLKERYLKGRTMNPEEEQELLLSAEKAKKILSKKEKTRLYISTAEGRVPVEVTREEFDRCTAHLMKKVQKVLLDLMMDLFEKGITGFDKIILVGGATRMPQIEQFLKGIPYTDIIAKDQDEAVAKGAAVYARLLGDFADGTRQPVRQVSSEKYLNRICTRSYGLAAMLGEDGERKVCNIIFRSTVLPVSKKRRFYTTCDNQRQVNLKIYENLSNEPYVNVHSEALLGNCVLELPEGLKKGSAIMVVFTISGNGVLTVEGSDPASGKSVSVTMESKALLEPDEVMAQKVDIEQLSKIY